MKAIKWLTVASLVGALAITPAFGAFAAGTADKTEKKAEKAADKADKEADKAEKKAAKDTEKAEKKAAKAEKKMVKEEPVSMDQVPAPVKATIDKEVAKGGTAGPVVMETAKGKTYYEVEITKDGKQRYVHIASDGKVMKRQSAKKEAKQDAKQMEKK